MALKIKKGDKVKIIAGKDKDRTGEVTAVIPDKNKVVVAGINLAKKHQKPNQENQAGGIIDIERPIDISNVKAV
jgi:large subunit ribosomal protein L24